jgi:SAM-dependent methyltransferase
MTTDLAIRPRAADGPTFRDRLSTKVRQLLAVADAVSPEARAMVDRAIAWCERAGIAPKDFTQAQAWVLGHMMPNIMPGAWDGLIPPVTRAGRHRRIDDYVLATPWRSRNPGLFVDIGCGFPPMTTVDSANALGSVWQIVGVDPEFHPYLLTDAEGNHACLDEGGRIVYFQCRDSDLPRWGAMVGNAEATRAAFRSMAQALRRSLDCVESAGQVAMEMNGARLERHPLVRFSKPNLSFLKGSATAIPVDGIDVARCFNVLRYFDAGYRTRALAHLAGRLKPGGLFLCGADWTDTSSARYTVYRNEEGRMTEKEFAFGIDNVRPVSAEPLIVHSDDDHESCRLADAVGVLRSDTAFRCAFDEALDAILADLELCPRGADGTLGGIPPGMSGAELERRLPLIETRLADAGFTREAVATLRRHGVDAWINCVGHVAIGPGSQIAVQTKGVEP